MTSRRIHELSAVLMVFFAVSEEASTRDTAKKTISTAESSWILLEVTVVVRQHLREVARGRRGRPRS